MVDLNRLPLYLSPCHSLTLWRDCHTFNHFDVFKWIQTICSHAILVCANCVCIFLAIVTVDHFASGKQISTVER